MELFTDDFLKELQKVINDGKHRHQAYQLCADHAETMAWHVYGTKPTKLLQRTRPREDPAITKYRLDSYEPITQSVCKKAISIVHKIFNPKLYSIVFGDDKLSQQLKTYSLEEYPRFNSVMNYLAHFSLKKMVADPNAFFLVQPVDYTISQADRVQPIVTSYASAAVHLLTRNYVLFFDEYNEQTRKHFYTYVDKAAIHKIVIHTNGQRLVVESLGSYYHNFGVLPVWQMGGEYSNNEAGIYESYFSAAVPFWNEAINDHSDVTGAYRMHMWPQKWEVADECDYLEDQKYPCTNGQIFNTETGNKHTCPACKGAGRKSAKGPYETYWVNRDKFQTPGQGTANVDIPFGYVSVPVEATKMLEDKANRNLEMGLNALAMDVVNKIGENQSGVAKEIDRSELNDFLQKIADRYFEVHLPNIFYYFTRYMFAIDNPEAVTKLEPTISKPTQFDIYSTTELTAQFAAAKEAKLNPSYLTTKQAEIQSREFQTHPELLNFLNLELKLDPLSEVTRDEVSLMLSGQTVKKETAIIHDNIKDFIQRALEEDPKFGDKKTSEQKLVLEKYAKEVMDANKVKIDLGAIQPKNLPPTI